MLPSSFTCLLANVRRSASKLINFMFSQGCLTAWQLVSGRVSDPRESEIVAKKEVTSLFIALPQKLHPFTCPIFCSSEVSQQVQPMFKKLRKCTNERIKLPCLSHDSFENGLLSNKISYLVLVFLYQYFTYLKHKASDDLKLFFF